MAIESILAIRQISVDNTAWVALNVPIAAQYCNIVNGIGAVLMRSDSANAASEFPLPANYLFNMLSSASRKMNVGDTLAFFKGTSGVATIVYGFFST